MRVCFGIGEKNGGRSSNLTITGNWDLSAAYWSTNGDTRNRHKKLGSFAVAPVLRIGVDPHLDWIVAPFMDFSVGLALHTNTHLGNHNLGSFFAFQDKLGIGLAFGKKQAFSLSYHYLHYSNARIFPPNDGINVKYLFEMSYRFV
jgi:lipid A 3-O-deacylase